jgi:hypothetical protein
MALDKLFNVATAIVGVAAITAVVGHPESANVIKSIGNAFSGSISAALGSAH